MAKNCVFCGSENEETAFFCTSCGKELEEHSAPVFEQTPEVTVPEDIAFAQETRETAEQGVVCGEYVEKEEQGEAVPVAADSAQAVEEESAEGFAEQQPGKKFGIASLVLGIVGILGNTCCSCCGCLGKIPTFVAPLVGLILGIVGVSQAKKAGAKNGLALAGLIVSIGALVIFIAVSVFSLVMNGLSFLLEFDPSLIED
ncbi:MAG: hypothetical protein IJ344_06510, partial [Clostridia bacterium]|nr:hypothetical protein [Clostridia bacterium]